MKNVPIEAASQDPAMAKVATRRPPMSTKNKVRVVGGALFAAVAAALAAVLCTGGSDRNLRWLVALPVCAAVVTPGQMFFC